MSSPMRRDLALSKGIKTLKINFGRFSNVNVEYKIKNKIHKHQFVFQSKNLLNLKLKF